jgi:hypothetical protein
MTVSWQEISGIIGAIGGLCGFWSLWYARRQTHLMQQQMQREAIHDKDELGWSERFERLANQLVRINPGLSVKPSGYEHGICLYPAIFPDPRFREALENYVVHVSPGHTQFSQRNPRPDELRRSNLRETVKKAERCMADFQKQNPKIDLKYYMGFVADESEH